MIRLELALAYLEVFVVQKSVYYKRPDGVHTSTAHSVDYNNEGAALTSLRT